MGKMSNSKKARKGIPTLPMYMDTSDGELIDIKELDEKWSEYVLKDGTILRVKPVIMEIRRLKKQFAPNGDPVYAVKNTLLTEIKAPANLKRK
jgi:hypothetical protein